MSSQLSNEASRAARGALHFVWHLVRLPMLALLILCAPLVQVICGGMLLLGVVIAIAFEVSSAAATFPFWTVIALSLGFGLFVVLYYVAIELLSRD